jgi:hypothetical protein
VRFGQMSSTVLIVLITYVRTPVQESTLLSGVLTRFHSGWLRGPLRRLGKEQPVLGPTREHALARHACDPEWMGGLAAIAGLAALFQPVQGIG